MDKLKLAFTIEEAAEVTAVGRTRLYAEIKAGRLRVLKVGRRTVVPRAAIEAWLAALADQSDAA